jgi:hypothetical protein
MRFKLILVIASVVSVPACSSPESETSVDLKPGQYEVTVANASGRFGPRAETKSLCFMSDHAKAFAAEPLKDIIPIHGCDDTIGERKGNTFSGTRQCVAEPGDGIRFEMRMDWHGQLSAESFNIDASLAMKGMSAGPGTSNLNTNVTITGKRTGDCM